jgi:tetratricopeptide (TPR) repeat protein
MVQYAMGVYHALQGENDLAIGYFDKAIQIFPYFMAAHFNKAVAYKKKLDMKNMVQAFQKVVEIGEPESTYVLKSKEFLQGFEQHIREKEGLTLEAYFRGLDQFEKGVYCLDRQDWEQAIDHFKQCIMISKKHLQSYGNMGICYAQLGQKALALEALDKALELDPDYELAIINRLVVASLKDGERLPSDKMESVEYYKEYPMKGKSYIQSVIQES